MIEENPSKKENERQYSLIDQMLSMHSSLRDRMERRAFWLNTALIGTSLFLCVAVFIGDDLLRVFGRDPDTIRFILGFVSAAVLLFSITEFRVDWRSVAGKHADAVRRLAELKTQFRQSFAEKGGNDAVENNRLATEYARMMDSLPPIPERWFNILKAEHRFKKLISERISRYPKSPFCLLYLQLRIEGIIEAYRGRKGTSG